MCRPRCRGNTGFCSSGYWTVKGLRSICVMVNRSPNTSSLITASTSCAQRDHGARDQDVEQTERKQHLPAEVHEAVVTQARKRPAHPHHEEEEDDHLAEEPEGSGDPVEGVEWEERQPPAEEEGRRDRADDHHVHVFAEKREAEAHGSVLGVIAGDELCLRLWKIERCTVRFGEGSAEIQDEGERLQHDEPGLLLRTDDLLQVE